MATQAELRQAIGDLVDSLGPYVPRTITVTTATSTSVVSADLKNLPADSTLMSGGYFRQSTGAITYVSGPLTQATGTVTTAPFAVTPSPGEVLEYWKSWRPTVVDNLIKSAWNEMRRKLWTPTVQVWTVRDLFRRMYTLPESWSHLSKVSWGQALAAGGVASQPGTSIPTGVPGPGLYDFVNVHNAVSNTDVAEGFQFTGDTWIRYFAVYIRRVSNATTITPTITLAAQTGTPSLPTGTTVTSGVQNLSDIPAMPQWVVFDLGTPYKFLANTQYHLRMIVSGSVDPNNYVQWGRTLDTTTYSYGQVQLWNGSTWTQTGYNSLFLPYREQGGWIDMEYSEWGIRADRILDLLDYQAIKSYSSRGIIVPDGTLIRIEGEKLPSQPSDTAQLEMPYDYLLSKVAYDMVKGRIKQGGFDPDDWSDRLRDWKATFEEAQSIGVLRRPQGSRRILDATP